MFIAFQFALPERQGIDQDKGCQLNLETARGGLKGGTAWTPSTGRKAGKTKSGPWGSSSTGKASALAQAMQPMVEQSLPSVQGFGAG